MSTRWGKQKPPLGAQVNWAHPLARGLWRAVLLNEHGGSFASGNSMVGTWTIDGARFISAYDKVTIPSDAAAPVTVGSIHGDVQVGFDYNLGPDYPFFFDCDGTRNTLYHPAGTNQLELHNDTRVARFSPVFYSGDNFIFTALWDQSLDLQEVWIGNTRQQPVYRAGTWGSTALGNAYYIGNRFEGDVYFSRSLHRHTYIYAKTLTPLEIQWLNAEPYAFLQPPQPYRRFFGPTVAATFNPAWAGSATHIVGVTNA